ncbi:conserved hypothetical protein [Ixodes scapularis]|uniref:Tumor protein p53-inducible nuclear protein 1 n=1 Tax=Ixodes scapularis TaxID=6945 RepID=B7Q4N9_IXOSC|nr:conserved hypothetical protein [Ixodes scapularis]|eukprot:XP_002411581.1 conserved hypothetical protein [Ixodes scapularis]
MLSGIASYFLNAPTPTADDELSYRTMEAEDDWLLVDVAEGDEARLEPSPQPEEACMERSNEAAAEGPRSLPALLFVGVVDSSASSPTEVTPPSSPCPMDGSWYVTPPPCFVARRPVHLETSPLENLLIEHPSMSVYGPCPRAVPAALRKSRGLGAARKDGEAESQPALQSPVVSVAAPEGHAAQVLTTGRSMPGPRPSALAARAAYHVASNSKTVCDGCARWHEQLEALRPGQRAQVHREQRHLRRSQLERQNRTAQRATTTPSATIALMLDWKTFGNLHSNLERMSVVLGLLKL